MHALTHQENSMEVFSLDKDEKMKIDLHCHTEASFDCITPILLLPERIQQKDISVQAITDHNEVWGAQKVKEIVESDPECDLTIIVGEEISTSQGEIIALFLEKKIEPGLSAAETIEEIRGQNGLVLLPHGFDPLKRYRLRPEVRQELASEFDIIETFNARVSRPRWNKVAETWAEEYNKPMSGGSDAHRLDDIGAAWTETPRHPIQTPADLMRVLEQAETPEGEWTHPVLAFIKKSWQRFAARVKAFGN